MWHVGFTDRQLAFSPETDMSWQKFVSPISDSYSCRTNSISILTGLEQRSADHHIKSIDIVNMIPAKSLDMSLAWHLTLKDHFVKAQLHRTTNIAVHMTDHSFNLQIHGNTSGTMHTHTHAAYLDTNEHTFCSTNSVCRKKWPQGDWINYFWLQVGVFGCQTSHSHMGNSDTASWIKHDS